MRGLYEFLHSVQGKQMREHLEKGGYIQFGKSSIVFDKNDISDSKRKGGITGLGWYIKRGFLLTKYAGISAALVNF